MSNVKHRNIFHTLEAWEPKSLAYDWDNVGLQVGSKSTVTKGVLVTLDVTEEVVDEAIDNDINVIIANHHMNLSHLKTIDFDTFKGKVNKKLIHHEICVYASHTNLDIATV